jgi:hypothetical protein
MLSHAMRAPVRATVAGVPSSRARTAVAAMNEVFAAPGAACVRARARGSFPSSA